MLLKAFYILAYLFGMNRQQNKAENTAMPASVQYAASKETALVILPTKTGPTKYAYAEQRLIDPGCRSPLSGRHAQNNKARNRSAYNAEADARQYLHHINRCQVHMVKNRHTGKSDDEKRKGKRTDSADFFIQFGTGKKGRAPLPADKISY